MESPDKTPLTVRCDSSGSDETPDRNTPSPFSQLATQLNGNTPYNHDYANPNDLQEEVAIELEKIDGSRKKRNLIYEPISTKNSKAAAEKLNNNGFSSPSPPPRRRGSSDLGPREAFSPSPRDKWNRKNKCFIFLVVAVFILSLVAVSLSVLSFLSKDGNNSQNGADTKTGQSEGLTTVHTDVVDPEEVHQLRNNFTHLHDHVIPDLEEKIVELAEKLDQKSVEGKDGPMGPKGPAGAGDMSKCQYRTFSTKNSRTFTGITVTNNAKDDQDYKILAVTCSQQGFLISQLDTKRVENEASYRQYFCKCAGEDTTSAFKSTNGFLTCRIHYWRCPMTS